MAPAIAPSAGDQLPSSALLGSRIAYPDVLAAIEELPQKPSDADDQGEPGKALELQKEVMAWLTSHLPFRARSALPH